MHLSANGNYMKGARMHRLGNTLKRAVTVGAVLALTLGMATPATMSFADDAAGGCRSIVHVRAEPEDGDRA